MALVDPTLRALYDLKVSFKIIFLQGLSLKLMNAVVFSRFSSNVIPT